MSSRFVTLRAAFWMIAAALSFTVMAVAGRAVSGAHDTFEIMFFRSLTGIVIVLSVAGLAGSLVQIRTERIGLHIVRNIFHFTGQNLWFFAVALIPLAQLFALEFTTPLWVALLAPLLLGERAHWVRYGAAALGFTGILIIARPGAIEIGPGVISAALSALGFAGAILATKRLASLESVTSILFWLVVIQAILGAVTVFWDGQVNWPTSATLAPLLLIGICGLFSHFCITNALSLAPASLCAPFEFLRLPLAALVGLLLYREPLIPTLFLGAALIFAANLWNILAEEKRG